MLSECTEPAAPQQRLKIQLSADFRNTHPAIDNLNTRGCFVSRETTQQCEMCRKVHQPRQWTEGGWTVAGTQYWMLS